MKCNDSAQVVSGEPPWQGLQSTPRRPAGPRSLPSASPIDKKHEIESANKIYQSPQLSTPVTGGLQVKPRNDDGTSRIPQASGAQQKTSSQGIDNAANRAYNRPLPDRCSSIPIRLRPNTAQSLRTVTSGNDSSPLGGEDTIDVLNNPIPENENASLELPVLPLNVKGKRIPYIQRSGRKTPKAGETDFHVKSDSSKWSDDDIETPSRPPTVFTGEYRMKRLLPGSEYSPTPYSSLSANKVIRRSSLTPKQNSGNKRNDTAPQAALKSRGSAKNIFLFPGRAIQKVSDGGTQHRHASTKRTPVSNLFRSRSSPGTVSKKGNTAKTTVISKSSIGLQVTAMHNVPSVPPPVPSLSMVNTTSTVRHVKEDPLTSEDQETSPSDESYRLQSHTKDYEGSDASEKSNLTVQPNAGVTEEADTVTHHPRVWPLRNEISNKIDHTKRKGIGGNKPDDVESLRKSPLSVTEDKNEGSDLERRIFLPGKTLPTSKSNSSNSKTSRVLGNFRGLFVKRKDSRVAFNFGVTDEPEYRATGQDAWGSKAPQDDGKMDPQRPSLFRSWKMGEENREMKAGKEKPDIISAPMPPSSTHHSRPAQARVLNHMPSFSRPTYSMLNKPAPGSDGIRSSFKRGQSTQSKKSLTPTVIRSPIGSGRARLDNMNRTATSGHTSSLRYPAGVQPSLNTPGAPPSLPIQQPSPSNPATNDVSSSGPAELEPVKELIEELLKRDPDEENPTKRDNSMKVSK